MSKFIERRIAVPSHDCDIVLEFPGGKQMTIQCRPSNADTNYNGSLDILLPNNTCVCCWKGQDMEAAPQAKGKGRSHERMADQLVMELPFSAQDS